MRHFVDMSFYVSANPVEIEPVGKAKVILEGGTLTMIEFEFDYDETLLTNGSFKFKYFDPYDSDDLEWADFIFADKDYHQTFNYNFDVVYGPIANDNVVEQI